MAITSKQYSTSLTIFDADHYNDVSTIERTNQ